MDRALFPADVEVRQPALQYEADQVAFHILRRWVDGGASGVATGLAVTQNLGNGALVDLAVGEGFVPNNEFAQLTIPQLALALKDYTLGVQNYVCLLYTENQTAPAPHITDGTPRLTRAQRAVIPNVYTLADIQGLLPTSPDYSVPAQDRLLVCGIVPGNGFASPGVPNPIVPAQIILPPSNFRILTIQQPTNVTGVVVTFIDPTTPATTDAGGTPAQLQFDPTQGLSYKAPADASYGSFVGGAPPGGAPGPITGSGTYKLVSGSSTHYILVDVTLEMLPTVVESDTSLPVVDVYPTGLLQNFSSNDRQHRHLIGSGVPTPKNPHGLRFVDLAEDVATLLEGIVLGTGLMSDDAKATVPRIVTRQSAFGGTGGNARTLLWDIPLSANAPRHIRFYATGYGGLEVTINALWNPGSNLWTHDAVANASKLEIYDAGIILNWQASGTASWDDTVPPSGSGWATNVIRASGQAGAAGVLNALGQLVVGTNLLGTSQDGTPRVEIDYTNSAGARTLVFQSLRTGVGGSSIMRVYRANSTNDQFDAAEITFNCSWNAGSSQWNKDTPGTASSKLEIGYDVLQYRQRLSGNDTPWGDGAWDTQLYSNVGNMNMTGTFNSFAPQAFLAQSVASQYTARFQGFADSNVGGYWLMDAYNDISGAGMVREYIVFAGGVFSKAITINARFDGAFWNRDASAPAMRFTWNPNGYSAQSFDATGTPAWNDGSWVNQHFISAVPGLASFFRDGILDFVAVGANSNPASNVGVKNAVVAKNVCKAWAKISLTGAPSATVDEGFNIASASFSGPNLVVTFVDGFTSPDYSVNVTLQVPWTGALSGAFAAVVVAQTGSSVSLEFLSQNGSTVICTIQSGGAPGVGALGGHVVYLQVFGEQT